ncbi:acetyl-CoA hydrolase/transferase family protein [Janthinobacterium sp. PC23-8]|uniref:acetyl-CoA hydrolase/transferase family protein n=1 Tax=Janthinobacterium sp. PC23-8 TaxID=2012679 RepID=UPI000B96B95A|nr:acetyl-CoA hydrolase/transferase C-terminal domain-containing protein [Janthinobacterium sp. PC23-8]OYO26334.1 hypothetical protein CD932_24130 [Janthinobacterium sp. PC23-8]
MKYLHDVAAHFADLGAGKSIVIHSACAEPKRLASELAASAPFMDGVLVHTLMPMGDSPYAAPAPARHLHLNTFFPGRGLREAFNAGRVTAQRHALSAIPNLFAQRRCAVDLLLLQVSPPDAAGYVSLGVSVDYMHAALRRQPRVIAEVNPAMPHTCGDTRVHVDAIDWFVDAIEAPQTVLAAAGDTVDGRIAEHVASLLRDGAVLQIGIGALPDMVLAKVGHLRHLGLHSGIVTAAVRPLIESGVIDNSSKRERQGVSVATMAAGTQDFYDFLNCNAAVEFHPCSLTHDRAVLARIEGFCAINSVLQVDLSGRANAEQVQGRKIALPGGLPDFAAGATEAKRGLSILALRSSFRNGQHSNIVASLGAGTPVTVGAEHIDYVVTEYGIAPIRGTPPKARARGLIAIAHPDCREALEREFVNHFCTELEP